MQGALVGTEGKLAASFALIRAVRSITSSGARCAIGHWDASAALGRQRPRACLVVRAAHCLTLHNRVDVLGDDAPLSA